jgi:hypothetical protein
MGNRKLVGDQNANARRWEGPDSMRFNRQFDSNEMDESDSHLEKHDEPRISIAYGIVI